MSKRKVPFIHTIVATYDGVQLKIPFSLEVVEEGESKKGKYCLVKRLLHGKNRLNYYFYFSPDIVKVAVKREKRVQVSCCVEVVQVKDVNGNICFYHLNIYPTLMQVTRKMRLNSGKGKGGFLFPGLGLRLVTQKLQQ